MQAAQLKAAVSTGWCRLWAQWTMGMPLSTACSTRGRRFLRTMLRIGGVKHMTMYAHNTQVLAMPSRWMQAPSWSALAGWLSRRFMDMVSGGNACECAYAGMVRGCTLLTSARIFVRCLKNCLKQRARLLYSLALHRASNRRPVSHRVVRWSDLVDSGRIFSMAKRLIPLLDRVLVQKLAPPEKTVGGILLPETVAKVRLLLMDKQLAAASHSGTRAWAQIHM